MKVIYIVGARPNFIKSAPLIREMGKHSREFKLLLVHTGQHYDYEMSKVFFEDLELPEPHFHLGAGSGTHAEQTAMVMLALEKVLLSERPGLVVVFGDVNSTLAGALTAAKMHIPVAHVEAGLRSYNRAMPEEINRILVDHVSDLLLCPTRRAVVRLRSEGITRGVHWIGDTMYEMALKGLSLAEKQSSILSRLGVSPGTYCMATLHRAENVDDKKKLGAILDAFRRSGETIILPLHPRTQKRITEYGLSKSRLKRVHLIPPVSYLDMMLLESRAKLILTDSGGVQKEAFFFGVPCLTLRDETEWVETVQSGWNTLVGTRTNSILTALRRVRALSENRQKPRGASKRVRAVFGDDDAGRRATRVLLEFCREAQSVKLREGKVGIYRR